MKFRFAAASGHAGSSRAENSGAGARVCAVKSAVFTLIKRNEKKIAPFLSRSERAGTVLLNGSGFQ